uniref:CSON014703 protein n=1 Tax=Culicoides sonorensis TaxID=179676 RepID=A0A336ME58_CULSO
MNIFEFKFPHLSHGISWHYQKLHTRFPCLNGTYQKSDFNGKLIILSEMDFAQLLLLSASLSLIKVKWNRNAKFSSIEIK